jgi:hypothetical protein
MGLKEWDAGVVGCSISDTSPSISIPSGSQLKVKADTDAVFHTVTLTGTLTSGAAIASEIQTKVQALGGIYATATCTFANPMYPNQYYIRSGTVGVASLFLVDGTFGIASILKLGVINGGTERAGYTNKELSAENLKNAINASIDPLMAGVSATRTGVRVIVSGSLMNMLTDSDNLVTNFGITAFDTKPVAALESPDPWTTSAVCLLEQSEANYGLGELALWARVIRSNISTEENKLVLFAIAHFPLDSKHSKKILKKRVIVSL